MLKIDLNLIAAGQRRLAKGSAGDGIVWGQRQRKGKRKIMRAREKEMEQRWRQREAIIKFEL